jgi:FRG domain
LSDDERTYAEGGARTLRPFAEYRAVDEFMHAADRVGLMIPEDAQLLRTSGTVPRLIVGHPDEKTDLDEFVWPAKEMLSVIALAQHYGVPTRLLDWSWKPRVAAYLAVRGVAVPTKPLTGTRLVIWCLRALRVTWIGRYRGFGGMELVTAPQATNPNLAAQAGLFTLVRSEHEDVTFDELVASEIASGNAPGWLELPMMRKLTLPHSEARRLLRLLGLEGVNAAPGYGGVVTSLAEQRLWEK